jgi:CheY-like chemotaxis protein
MVHGLAAQSGGLFQLESEVAQGTRASIYLPVVDIDVEPRPQVKRDTGLAKEPLRILLVDDEDLVRVGTAEMLEALGHEVQQAGSGPGAVQILRASRDFDLLIADYMMPGMSGVSLVREAQQLKPELPALLITGYAAFDPQSADGLATLGKPFGQLSSTRPLAK